MRRQRDELHEAEAELNERDLIFVTLQGAVDNERKREAALRLRLSEVEKEHARLAATLNQGYKQNAQASSPVTVLGMNNATPTRTQAQTWPIPPHERGAQSHQLDARRHAAARSENSGRVVAPGSRRNKTSGGNIRRAAPSASASDKNEYVDIFGGRRH